jgi:hypothetical protein
MDAAPWWLFVPPAMGKIRTRAGDNGERIRIRRGPPILIQAIHFLPFQPNRTLDKGNHILTVQPNRKNGYP